MTTPRIALVTGGGTGIGAEISRTLAERGMTVMIVQPTAAQAQAAALELDPSQERIRGVGADLATAEGCRLAVWAALDRYGRLDTLVNNAAVTGPSAIGPFLDFTDEHLDAIVDVNLKASFRCARLAARDMATRGQGVIVNIASVCAYVAQQQASAYVATKAAIVGLTKSLALELAPLGIRAVAVAPGDIDTTSSAGDYSTPPMKREWWQRHTPIGRRGAPADVAAAVGFLCSDEASFISGSTLVVDGGWLSY